MINEKCAKNFCKDDISKIENYELAINDKTQTWHCHHRRETIYSKSDLIEIGEYYHRPAMELIFLTPKEHKSLHLKGNKHSLGKHHSDETRKKMSESLKGKNTWMNGRKFSDETRKKMSEYLKGNKRALGHKRSEETRKKMSESHKGLNTWMKGRKFSDETKRKISQARKLYWEKQRQLKTNSDK